MISRSVEAVEKSYHTYPRVQHLNQLVPPGAHVDDVEVRWETYRGEFSGFEIRYG
jgi:acylphosphatase